MSYTALKSCKDTKLFKQTKLPINRKPLTRPLNDPQRTLYFFSWFSYSTLRRKPHFKNIFYRSPTTKYLFENSILIRNATTTTSNQSLREQQGSSLNTYAAINPQNLTVTPKRLLDTYPSIPYIDQHSQLLSQIPALLHSVEANHGCYDSNKFEIHDRVIHWKSRRPATFPPFSHHRKQDVSNPLYNQTLLPAPLQVCMLDTYEFHIKTSVNKAGSSTELQSNYFSNHDRFNINSSIYNIDQFRQKNFNNTLKKYSYLFFIFVYILLCYINIFHASYYTQFFKNFVPPYSPVTVIYCKQSVFYSIIPLLVQLKYISNIIVFIYRLFFNHSATDISLY